MTSYDVYKVPKFEKDLNKLLSKSEFDDFYIFLEDLKEDHIAGKRLSYDYFVKRR